MPALDGMALFDVRFDPGGMGELHWHANAHELGYQLEGEGEVGIFSTDGTGTILPVEPGTVTFIPRGYFHYFRNLSAGPMHRAASFSNAGVETYLWSATLPQVPQTWLAATFGLTPSEFPFLAARGTQFVSRCRGHPGAARGGAEPVLGAGGGGGTDGLSRRHDAGDRGHGHPGSGRDDRVSHGDRGAWAERAALAPQRQRAGLLRQRPGPDWDRGAGRQRPDVRHRPRRAAFVPANWFHYIANVSDEPLEMLSSFATPNRTISTCRNRLASSRRR